MYRLPYNISEDISE